MLVWAVAGDVHMYMGVHLLVMPLVTCCVQCGRSVIDGTSLSGVSVCVCAQSISVTVCVPNREDFIFNNRDSHACAVSSVSSVVCPLSTCDLVAVPVSDLYLLVCIVITSIVYAAW